MSNESAVALVIALDIGSSSIRCTPYQIISSSSLTALPTCSTVKQRSSVRPNTGKIALFNTTSATTTTATTTTAAATTTTTTNCNEERQLNDNENSMTTLFDDIDSCIDFTLILLRSHYNNNNSHPKQQQTSLFQIVALGISSFVMNLIGIDEHGNIINEECTLSYACNSLDVVQECKQIQNELSEETVKALYQRTGAPLHSAYALSQLRVIYNKNNNNKNNNNYCEIKNNNSVNMTHKVHQWTTIASYCIQRWSGAGSKSKIPISYSEASWTGLFNFHNGSWDDECCNLLPQMAQTALPNVSDYKDNYYYIEEFGNDNNSNNNNHHCIRRKRNQYFDRWPELCGYTDTGSILKNNQKCKLILGFGDGVCANIGSKCSTPERIACTIGTSAAARVCLPYKLSSPDNNQCTNSVDKDEFIVPFGLFCYRIDKDRVLLGGALTDGGSIIEFFRKLVNLEDEEAFNKCLNHAAMKYENDYSQDRPMNSALTVIPFLSGERSTGFRGGASGSILGLTRETTTSDLLISCLASVVLRLHQIVKLMESSNPNLVDQRTCFVASGNALERNSLWRQMLSDCTGKKVVMDGDTHEGTSRGVAILISQILTKDASQTLTEENLVIENEVQSNHITEKFWSKQEEYQDSAIDCVRMTWK